MAVEGGMKCIKYLIFGFNFLFSLCGIALIVVGVLVQLSMHNTFEIKDVSASGVPILIISIGVTVFFVAFFGCCGAWRESYCMVTTFAILLLLMIFLEIAAVTLGYVYRDKVATVVGDSLVDMIDNYNTSQPEFRKAVDDLQMKLKCCGLNSTADWRSFSPSENSVPDSCCIIITENCGQGTMNDATKVYQRGCQEVFIQTLKDNLVLVIGVVLAVQFLQVLGLVFACMLMKKIRNDYEVM